jgi:nucleotide-binding universal stress UspA family protein
MSVMIKKILTTTDLSAESLKAVKLAAELAEKLGASVTILAVTEFTTDAHDDLHVPKSASTEAYRRDATANMKERVEQIRKDVFGTSKDVSTAVVDGRPVWKVITDHAREHGFDTIVMATRGVHGLERVMLGSTTERVVRHAHCAVLTVHT